MEADDDAGDRVVVAMLLRLLGWWWRRQLWLLLRDTSQRVQLGYMSRNFYKFTPCHLL